MNKEVIFAGLIGTAVGGAIAGFATYGVMKRKYTKILDETVDSYEKLLNDAEALIIGDDIPDEFKRYIPEEEKKEEAPKISEKDKEIIKEKLRYNNSKTTSYANMYTAKVSIRDIIDEQAERDEELLNMAEAPEEPDPDDEGLDETEGDKLTNIFEAAKASSKNPPKLITEEAFNDICDNHPDTWDVGNLFLYSNDVITTEDDRVVDKAEVDKMLGTTLDKYDFRTSNEKTIYVQNTELSTVYEICKINKPFNN